MAQFEMNALDKFQIKGVGLIIVGDVKSGSVAVGDKATISNGDVVVESIVTGIVIGRERVDNYTYSDDNTEIGLAFPNMKRSDLKGATDQYVVTIE